MFVNDDKRGRKLMFSKRTINALLSASMLLSSVGAGLLTATSAGAEGEKESKERPHMDLAFCIDTTGSMGSEIGMVKAKTKELVAKLSTGKPAPVVRVGLVAYRDRGDSYVTKVFPFSDDIDQVVKDISDLQAGGGGDKPEALNQGLHAALNELHWDDGKKTAKILFVIGDAGPKFYPHDFDWKDESRKAIARGIQVNTIGCMGLEPQGTEVFKEIAKLTDGTFDTLAYRQQVTDAAGHRSTIVTAGGEAYRLKGGSSDDWKSEVARGAMEKVDAPVATAAPAMSRAMHSLSGASAGIVFGARDSSGLGAGGSRGDSNLDEIMLGAAKKRAAKVLNVEYGH
jgi:Mg-chelatase subunit ChlD